MIYIAYALGWTVVGLYVAACIWIGFDAHTGGKLARERRRRR